MGGGVVLNMARAGIDLRGVVSFHGSLAPIVKAGAGRHQGAAPGAARGGRQVRAPGGGRGVQEGDGGCGGNLTFIAYPGAIHSFTNPEADEFAKKFNLAVGYNAEADRLSWGAATKFLADVLK